MWQDLDGLGGAGVNSGAHQLDQFGTTELTPEHQKILIDIRRKKTELLLEIQVSQLPCFSCPLLLRDSVLATLPARAKRCREKEFFIVLSDISRTEILQCFHRSARYPCVLFVCPRRTCPVET